MAFDVLDSHPKTCKGTFYFFLKPPKLSTVLVLLICVLLRQKPLKKTFYTPRFYRDIQKRLNYGVGVQLCIIFCCHYSCNYLGVNIHSGLGGIVTCSLCILHEWELSTLVGKVRVISL